MLRGCLLAAAVTVTAAAAGCSGGAGKPGAQATARPAASASRAAASRSPTAGTTPASRAATAPHLIPVPVPAARLPQTRAFPSAHTKLFRAEMSDLWAAVVTGKLRFGMQSFFPLTAYQKVKAIADPAADWRDRLVADFRLDIGAAHRLLGRGARTARLVRVIVPSAEAAWIPPGACYNAVGYWHVAGARVLYRRRHGVVRSIGIASLISWRGRWYVVHFGAVLRAAAVGVVDRPAVGPGTPGPPGGC